MEGRKIARAHSTAEAVLKAQFGRSKFFCAQAGRGDEGADRERRKRPPKRMAGKMRERMKSPGPAALCAGSTVTSTCAPLPSVRSYSIEQPLPGRKDANFHVRRHEALALWAVRVDSSSGSLGRASSL